MQASCALKAVTGPSISRVARQPVRQLVAAHRYGANGEFMAGGNFTCLKSRRSLRLIGPQSRLGGCGSKDRRQERMAEKLTRLTSMSLRDSNRVESMLSTSGQVSLRKKMRAFFWPRKGFVRAWKYLAIRLARIKSSPHGIAAGFASGAAMSLTPLLGLHIILSCALAFISRGSMIAALFGTLVGNPVTLPIFFSATYWVGARVRDYAALEPGEADPGPPAALDDEADAAADAVLDAAETMFDSGWSYAAIDVLWPVISTMLIGAALLVPFAYAFFYLAVRVVLHIFRPSTRGPSSTE